MLTCDKKKYPWQRTGIHLVKEKVLKENIGHLPRVLFFNAFELGAE
jgi:hypothetical protein